jgi:hypothetical protein
MNSQTAETKDIIRPFGRMVASEIAEGIAVGEKGHYVSGFSGSAFNDLPDSADAG